MNITEQEITKKPMSNLVTNLIGNKYGRLTVVSYLGSKGKQSCWLCKCDCGNEHITTTNHLRMGQSKSCGCLQAENGTYQLRKAITKHGFRGEPLYNVWKSMHQRCNNPNSKSYRWYGEKGILESITRTAIYGVGILHHRPNTLKSLRG